MAGATRSIDIDAPIEKVFDVITDYARYPEFLTEVKKTTVGRRNGSEVDVTYEVSVMKNIRYTLRMNESRPSRVAWSFVEGEVMKDNKGEWALIAVGEGKTRVSYTVDMALGALVPKAIVNTLVETSLPKMLEAFKKRIEGR